MFQAKRVVFFVMVAIFLLALPTSVMANKRIFKANLSPIVEGVSTSGGVVLSPLPVGVRFEGAVRKNSTPVNGVYVLKRDGEGGESFRLSLCDMPNAICEIQDDGILKLVGIIKLSPAMGVTGREFMEALEAEQLEILVTTEENPAGEAGGVVFCAS